MFLTGLLGLLPLLGLGFAFFLPGAVPALIVLERGRRLGVMVAIGGSILLALSMYFAGRPVPIGLIYAAWLLGPPLLLALLLRRTESLSLCLQLTTLAGAILLVVLHVSFGDPAKFWAPFVRDLAQEMQRHGLPLEIDTETLVEMLASTLWGWIAVLTMLLAMCALFLARWWQALLQAPGSFGQEFQQLRLGVVLGVVAALVVLASFFADKPLLSDLGRLFLGALVIVGLAAAHRFKSRGRMGTGWLWAIYAMLVILPPLMVAVLAGWGFADNWMRSSGMAQRA